MAVKVTVYGTANMKQITAARGELDRLEKQATINAGGFRGSMQKLSDSASAAGAKMSAVGSSMTKNLTLPILAVGAGLYKATEAAAKDAQAQIVLANTLKNTAGATQASVAQTEDWIAKQGKLLGVSDDALRPALGTLATATHDVTKAQQLAAIAMDISASKGVPVEQVSKQLAKAYAGQFGGLQRLIPGIDQAAIKNKDFGAVMESVNKIVGGQAAAAANTEAGARQRANVALQESVEKLGTAFMPIMQQVTSLLTEQVVPAITKVADWFSSLNGAQKGFIFGSLVFLAVLGPVIKLFGMMSTAIGAVAKAYIWLTSEQTLARLATIRQTIVTWAQTVAQWALNIAMSANPIALIVIAIIALIAVLVLAWNNSKQFRDIVIGAWNAVVKFIQQAAAFLVDLFMNWTLWGLIIKNWDKIVGAVRAAWDFIVDLLKRATAFIVDLFMNWTIWGFLIKNWDKIVNAVKTAWNSILGFLNRAAAFIVDIFMNWTIWGFLIKNWNKIVVAVQTAWNKVITFFQQAPARIMKALGDVSKWLYDTGKNIIDGLWKGIQDTWGNVMNWVGGLFNGFIDKVKGLLGIASPSKVFAGIGANLGAGLTNGILAGVPAVQSAMDRLAGVTTGSMNASMTLATGESFATAGANAGIASMASSVSNSNSVNIASGAIQVSINGNADSASVSTAVQDAFTSLVRELRSR